MATVISSDKIHKHNIDKYNFRIFSMHDNEENNHDNKEEKMVFEPKEIAKPQIEDVDSSSLSQDSKNSLIESLMKKTDEMSSNFIKLQMKLEDKELEYEKNLENAKKIAFEEGLEAGKNEQIKTTQLQGENSVAQFSSSITKLETTAKEFELALENIKGELLNAALDIAKEVIKVDLNASSTDVAKLLSDELIKELQSASKITLKVSPNNHGAISQHVGSLKHIEVISDNAIANGGVIAISDAGNIDSQISKRFDRVKKVALSD